MQMVLHIEKVQYIWLGVDMLGSYSTHYTVQSQANTPYLLGENPYGVVSDM